MVVFLYIYFLPIFALVGMLYQISIDIYLKSYYTHRLCYSLTYVWLEYMWSIRVADTGVILVGLVMWGTKPWDITSSKNSLVF